MAIMIMMMVNRVKMMMMMMMHTERFATAGAYQRPLLALNAFPRTFLIIAQDHRADDADDHDHDHDHDDDGDDDDDATSRV